MPHQPSPAIGPQVPRHLPSHAEAEVFFTAVRWLLRGLTKVHLIPPHFLTLFERLTKDGEAFIEADKMGLFTTSDLD